MAINFKSNGIYLENEFCTIRFNRQYFFAEGSISSQIVFFGLFYQVHHHDFLSHYTYVKLDRKGQINHEFVHNRPLLCYGKLFYVSSIIPYSQVSMHEFNLMIKEIRINTSCYQQARYQFSLYLVIILAKCYFSIFMFYNALVISNDQIWALDVKV